MHKIPDGFYSAVTKPAHFKVGVTLFQLADSQGEVRMSTKDLAEFCHVSESTLTRAFRDLESQGYLVTVRSRKGFNRFSFNVYKLNLESIPEDKSVSKLDGLWARGLAQTSKPHDLDVPVALNLSDGEDETDVFPSLRDEQSTGDKVTNKSLVSPVSKKGIEILRISTPTGEPVKKSESEKKSKAKTMKLSMDPRDCRTRARRPIESWTTWDVAAEFAERLSKRYPLKPLLINQKTLAQALLPMRSKYNSNAKAEMILLEKFFHNNSLVKVAVREPNKIIGTFLNTFKTDLEKAIRLSSEPEYVREVVYADDGQEFDNSIPGRKAMERYNARLRASTEASHMEGSLAV